MKEKLLQVAESILELKPYLQSAEPITVVDKWLIPLRFHSKKLMQDITLTDSSVDCLLLALNEIEKGEESLSEAIKWLDKAASAYAQRDAVTVNEQLAEAIRHDIVTQLFSLSAIHYYNSYQKILKKIPIKSSNERAELETALGFAQGLSGYLLGRALESSQETCSSYQYFLQHAENDAVAKLVTQRCKDIEACSFINPLELGMSLSAFRTVEDNRIKLDELVLQCCIEGHLKKIPPFKSKLVNDIAYATSLLTLYTFPMELLAIAPAITAINVDDSLKKNELFYHLLTLGKEWTDNYLKNKADSLYPILKEFILTLEGFNKKLEKLTSTTKVLKLIEGHRMLKNDIQVGGKRVYKEKLDDFQKDRCVIENNLKQLSKDCLNIAKLRRKIQAFILYLNNPRQIIKTKACFKNQPPLQYCINELMPLYNSVIDKHASKVKSEAETSELIRALKQNIQDAKMEAKSQIKKAEDGRENVLRACL